MSISPSTSFSVIVEGVPAAEIEGVFASVAGVFELEAADEADVDAILL